MDRLHKVGALWILAFCVFLGARPGPGVIISDVSEHPAHGSERFPSLQEYGLPANLFEEYREGIDDVVESHFDEVARLIRQARSRGATRRVLQAADDSFRRQDFEQTIRHLEEAIELDPESVVLQVSLGELYVRTRRYPEALALASALVARASSSAQAFDILGQAYFGLAQPDEAIPAFKRVIQSAPDRAIGYHHLANVFFQQGRREVAVRLYERALEIEPELLEAWLRSGVLLVELGRYPEAVEHAERALDLRANDAFAHSILGNASLGMGDHAAAERHYREAVRIRPGFVYFRELLGRLYLKTERNNQAAELYRAILTEHPAHRRSHRALAQCYDRQEKPALAEYHRGVFAFAEQDPERALGHYRQAIQHDPSLIGAYLDMAAILIQRQNFDAAFSMAAKALELDDRSGLAHSLKGRILEAQGQWEPAVGELARAVVLTPDLASSYRSLGRCHAALGHDEQAVQAYQKAIERSPRDVEALIGLAALYMSQERDTAEAMRLAEQAAVVDPANPRVISALGRAY